MVDKTVLTAKNRSGVVQMYSKPSLSSRIFWTTNVATVCDNSDPLSMIRRHRGMISVLSKKLMTAESSTFTSAPITPKLVRRKYSKGRLSDAVFRNGYKYNGM